MKDPWLILQEAWTRRQKQIQDEHKRADAARERVLTQLEGPDTYPSVIVRSVLLNVDENLERRPKPKFVLEDERGWGPF